MAGTLFVVATPIGNLEDITARALRILREASVIAAEDTRRTAHLLAHYAITTPTTSLHEHNEQGKSDVLLTRLAAGDNVALVSDAGTPTISDPGAIFIGRALEQGIRVEPVPGPNAAIAALSASGFQASNFSVLGFPPTKGSERAAWFGRLANLGDSLAIFYEAPHRILTTLNDLHRYLGDAEVVVAREITKSHEELVKGPISRIVENGIKEQGEFTVVVNIGHKTNLNRTADPPSDDALAHEFGLLTADRKSTRRQAIASLSRRYGMSAKAVYAALESHKRSLG